MSQRAKSLKQHFLEIVNLEIIESDLVLYWRYEVCSISLISRQIFYLLLWSLLHWDILAYVVTIAPAHGQMTQVQGITHALLCYTHSDHS